MTDPTPNGFQQHDDDYEVGVPNLRKRAPERVGKPRAAQEADLQTALERIVADILARDTGRDGRLRWR
jgi:hypothetical protein